MHFFSAASFYPDEVHRLSSEAYTAGLVNTNEVTRSLIERVGAIETKMASTRMWNEKSVEMIECRNEG